MEFLEPSRSQNQRVFRTLHLTDESKTVALDIIALSEKWGLPLIPDLRPDDILIMDNIGSHKGPGIQAAIEAAGATVRYLLP